MMTRERISYVKMFSSLLGIKSTNQSINRSVYFVQNTMNTGPDTKGGCNLC